MTRNRANFQGKPLLPTYPRESRILDHREPSPLTVKQDQTHEPKTEQGGDTPSPVTYGQFAWFPTRWRCIDRHPQRYYHRGRDLFSMEDEQHTESQLLLTALEGEECGGGGGPVVGGRPCVHT